MEFQNEKATLARRIEPAAKAHARIVSRVTTNYLDGSWAYLTSTAYPYEHNCRPGYLRPSAMHNSHRDCTGTGPATMYACPTISTVYRVMSSLAIVSR